MRKWLPWLGLAVGALALMGTLAYRMGVQRGERAAEQRQRARVEELGRETRWLDEQLHQRDRERGTVPAYYFDHARFRNDEAGPGVLRDPAVPRELIDSRSPDRSTAR